MAMLFVYTRNNYPFPSKKTVCPAFQKLAPGRAAGGKCLISTVLELAPERGLATLGPSGYAITVSDLEIRRDIVK